MTRPACPPQFGPGTGSGRRPIPDELYLIRWSPVVESLKAGLITAEIKLTHGTCAETVRRIRRIMEAGGWTAPERERVKQAPTKPQRPKREPRPPKVGMTRDERLLRYLGVVKWLQAGKTNADVASLEGVSINTVRVVRRALGAQGKVPDSKR